MTTVDASVVVAAPPAVVWTVLTSVDEYGEWNPLIRRVDGRLEDGQRLRVLLTQTGVPPVVIAPQVTRVVPERALAWESTTPVPGAFTASHQFLLEPVDGGSRTRFTQTETFGGAAGGFVPSGLRERIRSGFVAMNEALRDRAESVIPIDDSADRNP